MPGTLILCATPIGNLDDASPRLAATLAAVDHIYAEDTRRAATLLRHLGVKAKATSYFTGNERQRAAELGRLVADGATVALVTDAGVPSISDPGYSAVAAALEQGGGIEVIPGPSAVTAALAISGLPADRFVFEGFLPRKGKARQRRLEEIAAEERTIVLFTATNRVAGDVRDLADAAGPERRVTVARELTKLHEQVWRGTLGEAESAMDEEIVIRGEFTLVVEGAPEPVRDATGLVDEVVAAVEDGWSTSDAVRRVATDHDVSRRQLYDAVVRSRGDA